jgi:hypothetical protein
VEEGLDMKKILVALGAVGAVLLTGCAPMTGHGSLDSVVSGSAQIEFRSTCSPLGNLVGTLEYRDKAAHVSLEGRVTDRDYTGGVLSGALGSCDGNPVTVPSISGAAISGFLVPFRLDHCSTDCTGVAIVAAVDGATVHHEHGAQVAAAPGCDAMVPGVDYVLIALQGSAANGYLDCGPMRRGGVEVSVTLPSAAPLHA